MTAKIWLLIGVVAGIVLVATGAGLLAYQPKVAPMKNDTDYAVPENDPQLGRRMYVHCQACHGINGEGVAGNYPPLAGSAMLQTDKALTLVLRGADRGAVWNGQMPAFADQMADHEIAAVLTWARQQWGNRGVVVTAADVAHLRR